MMRARMFRFGECALVWTVAVVLSALVPPAIGGGPAKETDGPLLKLPALVREPGKTQPPALPRSWTCKALMAPFRADQLVVGEFVVDDRVHALRATLYGMEAGIVDLLVTRDATYRLGGPLDKPDRAVSLGRTGWTPPGPDAFGRGAMYASTAPVLEQKVEWWKVPVDIPTSTSRSTTWVWYSTSTGRPWRTMFASPATDPAVIGSFAMTYFPEFRESDTDLRPLAELCTRVNPAAGSGSAPDVMAMLRDAEAGAGAAERPRYIARIIPGLRAAGPGDQELPSWKPRFGMTTFMTPVNFKYEPFPTEVLYEFRGATQTQRTRMYQPDDPDFRYVDALLLGGLGYDVRYPKKAGQNPIFEQRLPGLPRPEWLSPANGRGVCKAVIENNPALSPGRKTLIITCPLVGGRIFWMWYTPEGRPLVFMETSAPAEVGTGLALADYYEWVPELEIPASVFKLPPGRVAPPAGFVSEREAFFHHGVPSSVLNFTDNNACFRCHQGPK